MSFHVGQNVECVDDKFGSWWVQGFTPMRPIRGQLYVVRAVRLFDFTGEPALLPALLLNELVNPIIRWSDGEVCEHPFWANRFRPVVERKTDIAIFTRMLTPNKERVS